MKTSNRNPKAARRDAAILSRLDRRAAQADAAADLWAADADRAEERLRALRASVPSPSYAEVSAAVQDVDDLDRTSRIYRAKAESYRESAAEYRAFLARVEARREAKGRIA